MSMYEVHKNKVALEKDMAEVKALCKNLRMSFSGDCIIDMIYLPKENTWIRVKCML